MCIQKYKSTGTGMFWQNSLATRYRYPVPVPVLTYLTRTSTTRYFPATAAHQRGVTVWTDLETKKVYIIIKINLKILKLEKLKDF
jgi:hypothetical protein